VKSYRDIPGDGGSGIAEQVAERRAAQERSLAEVRHLVAVGSGKGGVGKSTLTALLAAALRAAGRTVAILDADLNGPSQARLAGLRSAPLVPGPDGLELPRTPSGIGVASVGSLVPEPAAVELDAPAGGDSHLWRVSREFTFLAQLLGAVRWGRLDFLLVDLPPGAERSVQHAEQIGPRGSFLLVTIPSDLARGVVARSLSALRKTPNRVVGYAENMAGYSCAGCGTVQPLFPGVPGVELDLPRLASIPFDPAVAAAADRGAASATGPTARAVEALAARLAAELEGGR